MGNSILKKLPIALATVLVAANGFAAMDMESRVSSLEAQMRDIRIEAANGRWGARSASSMPNIQGTGWFANADLLYWKTNINGMEYSLSDDSGAGLPLNGNVQEISPDFTWGFRIGLGYGFARDGWDFHVVGTWYTNKDKDYHSAGPNTVIYPQKPYPMTPESGMTVTTVTNAGAKYNLNFRSLDFELGRGYYVSKFFAVRPHCGVEVAWLKQKAVFTTSGGDLENNKARLSDKDHFTGAGLRGGSELTLNIGKGFSILGKGAAALIYGYHETKLNGDVSALPNQGLDLEANKRSFIPNLQMFLGLSYDQNINNNKNHIGVSLGYETQYWFRANQMLVFQNVTPGANPPGFNTLVRQSEDIALQGVTLDVRFDF